MRPQKYQKFQLFADGENIFHGVHITDARPAVILRQYHTEVTGMAFPPSHVDKTDMATHAAYGLVTLAGPKLNCPKCCSKTVLVADANRLFGWRYHCDFIF